MDSEVKQAPQNFFQNVIKALDFVEALEVAYPYAEGEIEMFSHIYQTLAESVGMVPSHGRAE